MIILKNENMKKNLILVVSILALLIGYSACKTQKKINNVTGSKEVIEPFSSKEYKTDDEYFRANASGNSPNIDDARTDALLNAHGRLAIEIKSVITIALKKFTDNLTTGGKQSFERELRNETWLFVDEQTHNGSRVIGDKLFIENDKSYTCWVVIEISTKTILDGVNTEISKDQKLQISFDQKKFAEEVKKEKENRAKEKAINEK